MSDQTKIEWTRGADGKPGATWNPITGCSVVSPGCTNCYAMRLAGTRLQHHPSRAGLTRDSKAGPVWTGEVRLNEGWLDQPLRWRRPRRIFVCAHGDLFHKGVPDEWIDRVFAVMALAPHHVFQLLTKRPERMRKWFRGDEDGGDAFTRIISAAPKMMDDGDTWWSYLAQQGWPLPNVWLGVSVEDQQRADERIPLLLDTPAAVHWISAEPLLGPIRLDRIAAGGFTRIDALRGYSSIEHPVFGGGGFTPAKLDWIVAGGESGPGARPMHPDWPRGLRDQCQAAGVPFHFKQWGAWLPGESDGHEPARWQDGATGHHPTKLAAGGGPEWRHFATPGEPGAFALQVGKARAGRLLDGRTWSEFPA